MTGGLPTSLGASGPRAGTIVQTYDEYFNLAPTAVRIVQWFDLGCEIHRRNSFPLPLRKRCKI